jgi:CMP-N-acetylneuraminic acid synthetase
MTYVGFIPCRSGSERVLNKNTRPFAGFAGGLLELKLLQMSQVEALDSIIVSSNDQVVLDYAADFAAHRDARVQPVPRPDELGRSSTTMDEFILYIARLREAGTIVWTHVTSPFLTARHYADSIRAYELAVEAGHDCLVSVTKLQRFIWDEKGPVNYDPGLLKWPRSQDLRPLYEINHGMYIMPFAKMREWGDRVGQAPFFHELDEHDALDIDWEPQFHFLEQVTLLRRQGGQKLA